MEINENTLKPKTTGGLKIMTIFIIVLAAHVLVIGGMTTYWMLKGSSDPDVVSDKGSPKTVKVASDGAAISDSQALPGTDADKTDTMAATTTPPTTDNGNYTVPSAPTDTAMNTTVTPDNASAASTTPTTATPAAANSTTVQATGAPSAPAPSGPVITPAPTASPAETASEPANASTSSLSQEPAGTPYTVVSRDSLARIAHHHHITVAKLKAANNLKSDMLHIGQKLIIPSSATSPDATTTLAAIHEPSAPVYGNLADTSATAATVPAPTATAPATDTASDTAMDASMSQAKPSAKPAKPIHEHSSMASATGSRHLYTVVKGDTLTKIAHKFRTTTSAIMAANDSVDARKLRIGQKLKIPSQESRSANITPAPAQPEQAQPEPIEPRAAPRAQLANFQP
jgi:LysM repeat protein